MTEGIAIVIAAVITVGGMFGSNFLHSRSNERQRRKDSKERFFYEIYQRRLALYEDVIKTLDAMGRTEADLFKMSKQDFSDKVLCDFHKLIVLSNRLVIYGSPGAREIISTAISETKVIHKDLSVDFTNEIIVLSDASNMTPIRYVMEAFILLVNRALTKFAKFICAETGADLVNNRISEISKEVVTGKKNDDNKPCGNNDKPIGDHQ